MNQSHQTQETYSQTKFLQMTPYTRPAPQVLPVQTAIPRRIRSSPRPLSTSRPRCTTTAMLQASNPPKLNRRGRPNKTNTPALTLLDYQIHAIRETALVVARNKKLIASVEEVVLLTPQQEMRIVSYRVFKLGSRTQQPRNKLKRLMLNNAAKCLCRIHPDLLDRKTKLYCLADNVIKSAGLDMMHPQGRPRHI